VYMGNCPEPNGAVGGSRRARYATPMCGVNEFTGFSAGD